jgi:hypothetical protein
MHRLNVGELGLSKKELFDRWTVDVMRELSIQLVGRHISTLLYRARFAVVDPLWNFGAKYRESLTKRGAPVVRSTARP